MGHQASWHWLVAFVGPAWPCSSAESGYCGHWSPTVFLSVVVGEDICSSPLNIVPEIQESVRKTISFALFVAWTILILLDAHKCISCTFYFFSPVLSIAMHNKNTNNTYLYRRLNNTKKTTTLHCDTGEKPYNQLLLVTLTVCTIVIMIAILNCVCLSPSAIQLNQ